MFMCGASPFTSRVLGKHQINYDLAPLRVPTSVVDKDYVY